MACNVPFPDDHDDLRSAVCSFCADFPPEYWCKFRETRLYQVALISSNLILAYLGEHVLGRPRSY